MNLKQLNALAMSCVSDSHRIGGNRELSREPSNADR